MRGIWGGPASGFICIPAGAGPWDIRADKIPTSEFQIRIRYRPFCYPIKPGCPPVAIFVIRCTIVRYFIEDPVPKRHDTGGSYPGAAL